MAVYAPADSFLYLESNSLTDVVSAISHTDAWREVEPLVGSHGSWDSLVWFSRWTGIGSTQSVVAARAQIAAVVLNVGTFEEGDTLRVRPELAVIIETHTSPRRTNGLVKKLLGDVARTSYGSPNYRVENRGGNEVMIWSAPSGPRQIIATIDETVVIVANTDAAISTCLAVKHNQRPNLQNNPDLQRMRQSLSASSSLAFGFTSSTNAARLVAIAAPLVLGRSDSESGLQRTLAGAAAKLLGSIGWSASASHGGIEDRYLISLNSTVVSRLQPAFKLSEIDRKQLERLGAGSNSLTIYNLENPLAAWQGFESAVLSQLDALSAAVFKSLLKSALTPYGIEQPEEFLRSVGAGLSTVRLRSNSERSVVIARVQTEDAVNRLKETIVGPAATGKLYGSAEIYEKQGGSSAMAVVRGVLVLGEPDDVRDCLDLLDHDPATDSSSLRQKQFQSLTSPAAVVTYANDFERNRAFLEALVRAQGGSAPTSSAPGLEDKLAALPYSVTETTLRNDGLERRTQSSFGQLGALAAAMFAQ